MRVLAGLATLLLLSGCMSGSSGDEPVDPAWLPIAQRPVTPASLVSYLHDLSPVVPGLSFANATLENYRTPIGELVELDSWVARPNVAGPVPLVLEVTPYYGGGAPASLGRVGNELIARGYAVGVSSVRGTGLSGGCFTQGGAQEARDTAAVVEHLASQEWSNGNVGIMGVSYPGTTPQDVWVEAPAALKTIVPISGISDLYRYNFVHGVHINPQGYAFNAYYWALVGASPAGLSGGAAADPNNPGHMATAFVGEACTDQVDVQEGGASSAADGNKDAYWQERDFEAELRADWDRNGERASVFFIHGLQDWNVKPHMMEGWLPAIYETGVEYKVWLGQWGHAWPQSTAAGDAGLCTLDEDGDPRPCRDDWWQETVVAWFDQFLKERDTGILDAPRVQVQDDDGRWHHEQVWPPTDAAWRRFHLNGDASLSPDAQGGSQSYHDGGMVTSNLPATLPPAVPGGPTEARWRSAPLDADVLVSGMPVFRGLVTASGDRANLILSLAEELPGGTVRSFNFCIQSLNHVQSLAQGASSIAGDTQEVIVNCFPQDDVLHKGSRLVVIAAGNTVGSPGPGLTPLASGSTITIEDAWLDLPIDTSVVYEDPQPYAARPA